jgi:hypothetical protein
MRKPEEHSGTDIVHQFLLIFISQDIIIHEHLWINYHCLLLIYATQKTIFDETNLVISFIIINTKEKK